MAEYVTWGGGFVRRGRSTVITILVGVVVVGALIYATLKFTSSGSKGPGFYQGVTADWCDQRGGEFVPNVPAGGGADLGSCTIK